MLTRRLITRLAPCAQRTTVFAQNSPRWTRSIAHETISTTSTNTQSPADIPDSEIPGQELRSQRYSESAIGGDWGAESGAATDLTKVDLFHIKERIKHTTSHYGADVAPHFEPIDAIVDPPRPSDISLELLLASQCHMGHSTSLWNPANSRYIFGIRQGIHIISLDITAAHLRRAAKVVSGVAERGGIILFAGTRRGFDRAVVRAAELANGCHLFERWTPGAITNGQQILGRGQMVVVDENDRQITGYEEELADRRVLKPDLVVCLNPLENYVMLHECGLAGIPTIGIIDTDANPTWVTYPIPANDDSLRSVEVIAGILGRAGEEGQELRKAAAKYGNVMYGPPLGLSLHEDNRGKEDQPDMRSNDASRGRSGSVETPKGKDFHRLDPVSQEPFAQSGAADSQLNNVDSYDETELDDEDLFDRVASHDAPPQKN